MMSRFFSFWIFLLIGLFAYCQNPIKKVLYTCGPNEEFYYNEFYSNLKVKDNKFVCMTKNKTNSNLSLIWNGISLITAKDLKVSWVDVYSKEECAYTYSKNNTDFYIYLDGKTFGPYEAIGYGRWAYYYGLNTLDKEYKKNVFYFQRMGNIYKHDSDGTIIEMSGKDVWNPNDLKIKSSNGLHEAELTNTFRLLKIDDNQFVLPISIDIESKDISLNDFYITDLGECIVFLRYYDGKWKYLNFIVKDNNLEIFPEDYITFLKENLNLKGEISLQDLEQLRSYYRRRSDDKIVPWINESLQDKNNKHFFTAHFDYDYVMIDDKKIKSEVPIQAFYDGEDNSFNWVTIEGKSLILYSYKL